jgi:hypothetical protein
MSARASRGGVLAGNDRARGHGRSFEATPA